MAKLLIFRDLSEPAGRLLAVLSEKHGLDLSKPLTMPGHLELLNRVEVWENPEEYGVSMDIDIFHAARKELRAKISEGP